MDVNKGYRHRRPGFYDANAVSDDTATDFMVPEVIEGKATGRRVAEESLTDQSGAEEADINVLIRRFGLLGSMPTNPRTPLTESFVGGLEYREMLDQLRNANEAFDELPADVRRRFDNDPAKYLEFFEDKRNMEEARKLGLVPPPEVPVDSPELSVLKEIRDGFVDKDVGKPSGASGKGVG